MSAGDGENQKGSQLKNSIITDNEIKKIKKKRKLFVNNNPKKVF